MTLVNINTGEVVTTDLDVYVALDRKVDTAEGSGIMARWDFGRELLAEREANGGLQLPRGRIDEICAEIQKSQREVRYRLQLAAECKTEVELGNALQTFRSWHAICEHFGTRGVRQSNENEWYTPEVYVEAAREVLGGFDLDPASSYAANKVIKATQIYTAEDDGLTLPWSGRVWLNPPYGGMAGKFIERLVEHYDAGQVSSAIALVNATSTSATWFAPLWDHILCFTDHRIEFESAGREKQNSSTYGNAFVHFGPTAAQQRFADIFGAFGPVVRRWPLKNGSS